MKVYTGGGDKGKTSLFSGERVAKHSSRIEAYGDLDELNSIIGMIISLLPEQMGSVNGQLQAIQSRLFQAGAWLATTPGSSAADFLDKFPEGLIKDIEQDIDDLSEDLPQLKAFILPGGHSAASMAHVGRTVCRRCERRISQLAEDLAASSEENELQSILVYINRLSDYLFVAARYINCSTDTTETVWQKI